MAEQTKATPQTRANGITKVEAVRRALKALGNDATPSQLQPYIKQTFGIEMTPAHITTCKGVILRKGKKKPGPKPKEPSETIAANTTTAGPPLNKLDAVKRTLAALGPDAMPLAIQEYVQKHFGIGISTAVVSAYKKELKARAKKKPAPKPPVQPAPQSSVRQPAPTPAKNGISLEDIEAVQGLVGRVGPDQLKGLIDLLSR
jgi:hypothetical protein